MQSSPGLVVPPVFGPAPPPFNVSRLRRYAVPVADTTRARRLLRRQRCDRSDWMVVPEVFEELNSRFGPFTVDGCADDLGLNAFVSSNFYSPSKSFLTAKLSGEKVWVNPPFRMVAPFLKHYLQSKRLAPSTTSAVWCLPVWPDQRFGKFTACMELIKEYPAGSHIFTRPTSDPGVRALVGPVPWPVRFYYDPPVTPDKIDQFHSFVDSLLVADIVDQRPTSAVREQRVPHTIPSTPPTRSGSPSTTDSPDHISPPPVTPDSSAASLPAHAPAMNDHETNAAQPKRPGTRARKRLRKFARLEAKLSQESDLLHLTSSSKISQLLTFSGTLHNVACRVLVDSGASTTFVSSDFVKKHSLPVTADPSLSFKVKLANGQVSKTSDTVISRFNFGVRTELRQFVVTPVHGFDVVVGMDFFTDHGITIDAAARVLRFPGGKEIACEPDCKPQDVKQLNAVQFSKMFKCKKSVTELYLCSVKAVETEQDPTVAEPISAADVSDAFGSELQHRMRDVLGRFAALGAKPSTLPPSRPADHKIELLPGTNLKPQPHRRMSPLELAEVERQLKDLIDAGFVRPSKSSFAAPVV